jgi:hypothetical protein
MLLKPKKKTTVVNPNKRPMSVPLEEFFIELKQNNKKALRILAKRGF